MDAGTMQGVIGGIAGSLMGILGGAVGCYFSIKNTDGPRERAFVVKSIKQMLLCLLKFFLIYGLACVLVYVPVFLLWIHLPPGWLITLLFLPHLLWIPYVILLVRGILRWNKEQARIRQEEAQEAGGHLTRRRGERGEPKG
jgi:hypothetical protein